MGYKHQELDPLIRSVSKVTTALANVSLVSQLFSFLVVCSDMISKGYGLVAFFASVKASSVRILLSCLVCIQSVVHGVRSHLFCGHEGVDCQRQYILKDSTPQTLHAAVKISFYFSFSRPASLLIHNTGNIFTL